MVDINPLDFFESNPPKNKSDTNDSKLKPFSISYFKKAENSIKTKTKGRDIEPSLNSFVDLKTRYNSSDSILQNLKRINHQIPTAIQCTAIPILLSKRDLFGIAPTGSGKTAAFLIPAILLANRWFSRNKPKHPLKKISPRFLIIAPTRELMHQISQMATKLSLNSLLEPLTIDLIAEHKKKNPSKAVMLIATPYMLFEEIKSNRISFRKVRYLVLDEADRLLDCGDETRKEKYREKRKNRTVKVKEVAPKRKSRETVPVASQIDSILAACSHKKISRSLFSATLPSHIETLARTVLRDPIRLTVGMRNVSTKDVDQKLLFVGSDHSKLFTLKQILDKDSTPPILVFVQTKFRAEELSKQLQELNVKADFVTSARTKAERDDVMIRFGENEVCVLVCTGLVARGIDFQKVSLVVNFDFPQSVTEYVHRVGRSGRAGCKGKAITFFTETDKLLLRNVAETIRESGGEVPEWILKTKRVMRSRRKHLKFAPPKRKRIKNGLLKV